MNSMYVSKVVDLTNPEKNVIYNMTHEEAVDIVRSGDIDAVRKIDGQFSLISVEGKRYKWQGLLAGPYVILLPKEQ